MNDHANSYANLPGLETIMLIQQQKRGHQFICEVRPQSVYYLMYSLSVPNPLVILPWLLSFYVILLLAHRQLPRASFPSMLLLK